MGCADVERSLRAFRGLVGHRVCAIRYDVGAGTRRIACREDVAWDPVGALIGSMTIAPVETPAETLAMLALVGWYRLVLEQMDDEAAMLAATMAAVSAAAS